MEFYQLKSGQEKHFDQTIPHWIVQNFPGTEFFLHYYDNLGAQTTVTVRAPAGYKSHTRGVSADNCYAGEIMNAVWAEFPGTQFTSTPSWGNLSLRVPYLETVAAVKLKAQLLIRPLGGVIQRADTVMDKLIRAEEVSGVDLTPEKDLLKGFMKALEEKIQNAY